LIGKHKTLWPVTLTCEALAVSARGFFEHRWRKAITKPRKPGTSQRISDDALLVHIKTIHAEVKQEYGWPEIRKELVARGIRVGKQRVKKMQRQGITVRGKSKFLIATDSKHKLPIAKNLLNRNLTPEAPNQVWTTDICRRRWNTEPPGLWKKLGLLESSSCTGTKTEFEPSSYI
jgi:putative transposase